jgi:hypothetical protein
MSPLKLRPHAQRNINSGFPHQVAFRAPLGAAGGPFADMDAYCAQHLVHYRTRRDIRRHLRYCFSNSLDADSFASVFGGDRITIRANG